MIFRRTVRFGVVLAVLAPVATALAITLTISKPVNISRQPGYNAEGTIAVDPTDPRKVFAGFNNSLTSSQWRRSTDSGSTWTGAGVGLSSSCCDNVAEWDSYGNLFLTNLNPGATRVPLYLSTDDGASFVQLTQLDAGDVDQPTMKAGPGSLWVTWNNSGTIRASGAAVDGLGTGHIGTFSSPQDAPGSTDCQFGDIAVSPAGTVVDVCQTDTEIWSYTDPDGLGAAGFEPRVVATPTNVDKFDPITPQPNRTIDAEANLAYDLSSGPHAGRLYLVYTDAPAPPVSNMNPDPINSNTDIYLRHSDDDGQNWSAPTKVNDDATTTSQFFPVVTVDPVSGDVFVSWLDCRDDPVDNTHTEYWGAVSVDGGGTFTPNVQLSAGRSSAAQQSDQSNEYGDYSGNDFYNGVGYAIWPDDSNSTNDNPDTTNEFDMYAGKLDTRTRCFGSLPTVSGTTGTPGNDVIVGTDGNDTIDGQGGNDKICGLGGNDTIDDGPGNDRVDGGSGNDTFLAGSTANGTDTYLGGSGTDTVDYSGRNGNLVLVLKGGAQSGQEHEKDTIGSDVENATGGNGDDTLKGNDSANTLVGGPGDDKLVGGGASDTLNAVDGVEGNDSVDGSKEKPTPLADTCTGDTATSKPDKIKNC